VLKFARRYVVWLAGAAMVLLAIAGIQSLRVPLAASEYQECLKGAQSAKRKSNECKPYETMWERTASDPVAFYTLWLTAFTGVLAVGGVIQLRFLVRADRLSARAAKTSEQAMITGQRAYLFADGYRALFEVVGNSKGYHWRFRPVWRNTGDTAPTALLIYTACEVRTDSLPPNYNFPVDQVGVGSGFISPKGMMLGGQAPRQAPGDANTAVTPQDVADAQSGKKTIYLWGWAAYNDVFEGTPRRFSRFCYVCVPVGNPMVRKPDALRWDYVQDAQGNAFGDLTQ
jgi:hypothetical protein